MIWQSAAVVSKVITVTITPAAGQRVVIKHIVGSALANITIAGSTTSPCKITASPIVRVGGTYTFADNGVGNTASSQLNTRCEWITADPSDPNFWLMGAAAQAITVTYDGTNIGTWPDGDNGLLQVFGYLDGRTGGVESTIAEV